MNGNKFTQSIKRFTSRFGKSAQAFQQPTANIGMKELSDLFGVNSQLHDNFNNTYSSLRVLVGAFAKVLPFAMDGNGNAIDKTPHALSIWYNPNQDFSAFDFRKAIAAMVLSHRKCYVLVVRKDGDVLKYGGATGKYPEASIAGYVILEDVTEIVSEGHKFYTSGGKAYSRYDIIEFFDMLDPSDLQKGISPTQAAQAWSNLDDYIVSYESGLFENHAVPAGQMVITAESTAAFNAIVDKLEASHRGKGKNNNIVYTHRPIDRSTSKPVDSQIVWVPFGQSNSDMKVGEIYEHANKKIDSAFGVPASMRGVNTNNTYASVNVDKNVLGEYSVSTLLMAVYTRLTHELNRITGGLGYSFSYNYEAPGIADEEKVRAETKMIETNIVIKMAAAGFTIESVVAAYELNEKLLELESAPVTKSIPDPVQPVTSAANATAKKKDSAVAQSDEAAALTLSSFEDEIFSIAAGLMKRQIERSVVESLATAQAEEITDEDLEWFAAAMVAAAALLASSVGEDEYRKAILTLTQSGKPITNTSVFKYDKMLVDYDEYIRGVGKSYGANTAEKIQSILLDAKKQGLSQTDLAARLRTIPSLDDWRIRRLAVSETANVSGLSTVNALDQIQNETGVKLAKTFRTNSANPCEFCASMDGTKKPIDEPFLALGAEITGVDGGIRVNDFVDRQAAQLHPNCGCYLIAEIVE